VPTAIWSEGNLNRHSIRPKTVPRLYRKRIVLGSTQARAELPARSRWTIAASRIEPHRAGAVALRAVEHTDPDAVVGGPVRGCAAGYPHARLHVVGELPVAGAFVARRLDWLCCDGGCRGQLDCSDPLFGRRRLRAGVAPQGRGEVEPVRVAAGAYHGPLGQVDQEGQPPGRARPVRSTRFTWKYPGWSGTGRAAIGRKRVSGAAVIIRPQAEVGTRMSCPWRFLHEDLLKSLT
jgi:hypothetical protein